MKTRRVSGRRFVVPFVALGLMAGVLVGQPAVAGGGPPAADIIAALEQSAAFPGTAWGVDPAAGQVVVSVDDSITGGTLAAVQRVTDRFGGAVRLEHNAGMFQLAAGSGGSTGIDGGDAIYGSRYRCSLGFNVVSGSTYYFLTAGHCGKAEKQWWTSSTHQTYLGATVSATFPGSDYSLVRYDASYTTHPGTVGDSQDVTAAGTAYVNEAVTRYGSTTGQHSGTVTALDVTVRYQGGGTVRGLIQTTVCAEPGDSGGPLVDHTLALGLTSGGSGDCKKGGTTFFQPVTVALAAYGVSVF